MSTYFFRFLLYIQGGKHDKRNLLRKRKENLA